MPKTDTILSAKSLRYFLQLIDTMNYTQAAQILGITQPALTQQIKKLERAIGAPLFGQMGKKLYLTEAGKQMQSAAVVLLNTTNSVVNSIQEFTQEDKGNISIGCLKTIEMDIVREFLLAFNKKYPNVTIDVKTFSRKELWHQLDNNLIDLAIMYLPDNTKRQSTSLQRQYENMDVYKDRMVILTHKDTVKAGGEYPVSRFVKTEWVTYPDNYYLTELLKESFGTKNNPKIAIKFASAEQLIKIAEVSKYDTCVTKSFYKKYKQKINLKPIYLKQDKNFTISLVYRKGKLEIPRIKNFLKHWNIFLDKEDYSSRLEEDIN
ncbi:LysR family transcriptional regulator [Lactobacillus hamsteri]|uniref:Transcriptional regulator n=1 Tax=Lactobacillus hamsteri DSM 5661 = JCM 6256 TaxID=1423754 RepID=A0A0R1YBG6_9LACO|nr:LysR family transcriptional regulator [Lactobacillus hamsteri]KRM39863.1 transcriptional regulator [Lactobacillus hamsteri DSM 5661 = JCM 6256]